VFANGVLRKTLGPRRDEVIGEWRRLHNEELITKYQICIIYSWNTTMLYYQVSYNLSTSATLLGHHQVVLSLQRTVLHNQHI